MRNILLDLLDEITKERPEAIAQIQRVRASHDRKMFWLLVFSVLPPFVSGFAFGWMVRFLTAN